MNLKGGKLTPKIGICCGLGITSPPPNCQAKKGEKVLVPLLTFPKTLSHYLLENYFGVPRLSQSLWRLTRNFIVDTLRSFRSFLRNALRTPRKIAMSIPENLLRALMGAGQEVAKISENTQLRSRKHAAGNPRKSHTGCYNQT